MADVWSPIPVRFCARCGGISETGWGRITHQAGDRWYCFDPKNKCCWDDEINRV